jgi:ABC-type proline/glycine betaine transport system substrate-binding protein
MEVLNASVKAARAGYTDTTKVAELLSKVINAYGYSARDAAYLSDVLFKTVEVGINSME